MITRIEAVFLAAFATLLSGTPVRAQPQAQRTPLADANEPTPNTSPASGDSALASTQTTPPQKEARASLAQTRLTLPVALAQALKNQPSILQAKAQTAAAQGRVEQARAGYLPQVTAIAAYQRTTGNFAVRPGSFPTTISTRTYSLDPTYNYYNASVTASQLIYDFGQTNQRWNAAEATADAFAASEEATRLQAIQTVQAAYYTAWAQRALRDVAEETLANQLRHLEQVESSVKVGVQAEISLATARANVANARLQLIGAQNAYDLAKDQLNSAMGATGGTDYDVADEEAEPIVAEDGSVEPLVKRALENRPDITSLDRQRDAQTKTIRALRGAYGPNLVASATGTEAGMQLNNMVPNWNVGITLTWPILQGGLTTGQVREAEATLSAIDAQLAALRLQVRIQVDQARLAVRAAKASIGASDEALENAKLQLKLAEGRFSSGVGNIIELTDAQVAYTNARAQVVQAHFNLSNSRAQLSTALGMR